MGEYVHHHDHHWHNYGDPLVLRLLIHVEPLPASFYGLCPCHLLPFGHSAMLGRSGGFMPVMGLLPRVCNG